MIASARPDFLDYSMNSLGRQDHFDFHVILGIGGQVISVEFDVSALFLISRPDLIRLGTWWLRPSGYSVPVSGNKAPNASTATDSRPRAATSRIGPNQLSQENTRKWERRLGRSG